MKYTVLSFIAAAQLVYAQGYSSYPQVPQTASINGFADPIYSKLPVCAQPCVRETTSDTPCPYWDAGCLCEMSQFNGPIGDCIARNCDGHDVQVATALATSLCNSVGASTWLMPATVSAELSAAATKVANAAEITSAP